MVPTHPGLCKWKLGHSALLVLTVLAQNLSTLGVLRNSPRPTHVVSQQHPELCETSGLHCVSPYLQSFLTQYLSLVSVKFNFENKPSL